MVNDAAKPAQPPQFLHAVIFYVHGSVAVCMHLILAQQTQKLLVGSVKRVYEAALEAFLTSVCSRHVYDVAGELVCQQRDQQPPALRQDGLVEAGFLSHIPAGFFLSTHDVSR